MFCHTNNIIKYLGSRFSYLSYCYINTNSSFKLFYFILFLFISFCVLLIFPSFLIFLSSTIPLFVNLSLLSLILLSLEMSRLSTRSVMSGRRCWKVEPADDGGSIRKPVSVPKNFFLTELCVFE